MFASGREDGHHGAVGGGMGLVEGSQARQGSRDTHPLGASPLLGDGKSAAAEIREALGSLSAQQGVLLPCLPQLWAQATPASPPAWDPNGRAPVGRSWAPCRAGMGRLLERMILGPPAGISSPTWACLGFQGILWMKLHCCSLFIGPELPRPKEYVPTLPAAGLGTWDSTQGMLRDHRFPHLLARPQR